MANLDIIIRLLRSGTGGTATTAELKAMESQALATGARLSALGGTMIATGAKISLATAPLVAFGVMSVKAASDAGESLNKLKVVFENNAVTVRTWAQDSARDFGLSRAQAYDAASSFGAMFKSMGMGQGPMIQMSEGLVEIAADLGSLYNADPSDMLERLRSGMVGEAEPLRRFGILLDEATVSQKALEMGLASTAREVTQADKIQARYALIVQQSAVAHGDFKNTSDQLANSTRIARAEMANAAAEMGTALIPLATTAAQQVTALAGAFANLDPAARNTAVALGGLLIVAGPLTTVLGGLLKVAGALAPIIGAIGAVGTAGLGLMFGAEVAGMVFLADQAAKTSPAMRDLAMAELSLAAAEQERNTAQRMLNEVTQTGDAALIAQAQAALDAANARYELNRATAEGLRATVDDEQAMLRLGEAAVGTGRGITSLTDALRAYGPVASTVAATEVPLPVVPTFTRESAILATLTGGATDAGAALAKTLTDLGNAAVMGPLSDAQMAKWQLIGELIALDNEQALKLIDTYAAVGLLISQRPQIGGPFGRGGQPTGTIFTPTTPAGQEILLKALEDRIRTEELAKDAAARRDEERIALVQAAAERALSRIQERWTALASAVSNAINDARSKARGLFDLTGGGAGGIVTEPGKGGPFEALYRILAVATAGMPGRQMTPETAGYAAMYPGIDYMAISEAFQKGMLLAPGVFENIDWKMLGEQAAAGLEAADLSKYAGEAAANLMARGEALTPEAIRAEVEKLSAAGDVGNAMQKVAVAVTAGTNTAHTDAVNLLGAVNGLKPPTQAKPETVTLPGPEKAGGRGAGEQTRNVTLNILPGAVQVTSNVPEMVANTIIDRIFTALRSAESQTGLPAPAGVAGAR